MTSNASNWGVETVEVNINPNIDGTYSWRLRDENGIIVYFGKSSSPQTAWDEIWTMFGP